MISNNRLKKAITELKISIPAFGELETGNFGDVAQLGERGVRNAEARSSILLISTNKFKGLASARPFPFGLLGLQMGLASPHRRVDRMRLATWQHSAMPTP